MARAPLTIDKTMTILTDTPRRIAALTADVPPARLRRHPTRDEWSVVDVLAHLRSCADARGDFIPMILAEDRPTLRAIDPRTFIKHTDYRDLDFATSFRAFVRQRARLLTLLRSLSQKGWSRTAIVTGGGLARERTVLFYAQWVARHEVPHVKQIASIIDRDA